MASAGPGSRTVVAVAGAGAAGTLVAIQVARTAVRRSTPVEVVLIDPADRWARGVSYGTVDDQHLLNVPAAGMSALPEEPGHFVAWRSRVEGPEGGDPAAFASRRSFGRYLDDTLAEAMSAAQGLVNVRHVRSRVVGVQTAASGVVVATSTGHELPAEALVLAIGLPAPGVDWAPEELRRSAFFVSDPWAPGALATIKRDRNGPPGVLLVGSGLTMVDVALSLSDPSTREDRVLSAVSRSGRLPKEHTTDLRLAAIPDVSGWGDDLATMRDESARHLLGVARSSGDWRPAVDGLRFRVSALWERLGEEDRVEFMRRDAGRWSRLRHRIPPSSALVLRALRAAGRLDLRPGSVRSASALNGGGLQVRLSDDRQLDVGWVVNCTGPKGDISTLGDPLVDDLLRLRGATALAAPATAGMGVQTRDGRLVDTAGSTSAPIWTLGAMRRGELWESTAVPEIRTQARALATAVLDAVAPLPRKLADGRIVSGHHPTARPRDPLGLPLTTTTEAAAAFNAGMERVMRLQGGGDELLREATAIDPDFALAHAALAMLGHEAGAAVDVTHELDEARRAARKHADDRERSLVEVVGLRVKDVRNSGAKALMSHISAYPRDVLAVSAAVPTIAFSGVTDVQQEAWDLVEGLAPAYGDHWWYISLLAFTRQDQSRFDDAGLLAETALTCEPSSGHAVHAQTHVLYETGQHETGRVWLDHWVRESGRAASHRAHFSWHAALHELALGDTEAVRQRYYSQLAPPAVDGVRALIDSASLLWRWRLTTSDWDGAVASGVPAAAGAAFDREAAPPPIEPVLAAVDRSLLVQPETPFVALHAAIALAAARDLAGLAELRRHCADSSDPHCRTIVSSVCDALIASGEDRWNDACRLLVEVLPVLVRVGGSAAQRDVIEETLLFCLVMDGQAERALALLDGRLDRRESPLDSRRRRSLSPGGVTTPA